MTEVDPVEEISEILAISTVERRAAEEVCLERLSLPKSPVLVEVLGVGFRKIASDRRYDDRARLKVMRLDPEFYDREARAEIERWKSRPATQVLHPELKAKREARAKARQDKAYAEFRELSKKLDAAFALYDAWTLASGKSLGDATREDLLAEAKREAAMASGHDKNSQFYEALAGKLSDGQCVRDGINITDAHKIKEDVYADEAMEAAAE